MTTLPSIWRTELWHPMMVHFPIVLLLAAAVLHILLYFSNAENTRLFKKMSSLSLYAGTIALWLAIYTGIQAGNIISQTICDPSVLHEHRNAAYVLGYLFSVTSVVDAISLQAFDISERAKKYKGWLVTALLVAGSFYMVYTAHLGASLVYQQSAGVYHPTEKCYEFK
ncbi:MAG: hypothetical protein PVI44_13310 [Balneolaceae bacterium]|jgi:uncharacterized membrane protein